MAKTAHDSRPIDFRRDVIPALTKAGCNSGGCHGSFQGRGGFRLSLLGFRAEADYDALVKEGRHRRLFPSAPDESLILKKPLGVVPHGGGKRFEKSNEIYRILRGWIEQGLDAPEAADAPVARIEVSPLDLKLQSGESEQVRVTAVWADGSRRDVTDWALYEARDEKYSTVTEDGTIKGGESGRTAVTVRYMGQVAAVTVTVPHAEIADFPDLPVNNYIDELIIDEWKKVGMLPAPLSSDEEFVRRVFLDLIGTLPRPDEIREFVASTDSDKRAKLIDALLERPEYVDYWSLKWSDLLRVHRRFVGDKGLWSYLGWVRRSVREDRPLNEMVYGLLTARGSLATNGAVGFFQTDEKSEDFAETTAQLFLGIRMQCARCHHHPYEIWSQEDYYGLANFFTRFEMKSNGDGGRYGGATYLRPLQKVNREMRVKLKVPTRAFGHTVDVEQTDDVRRELAEWITARDNPYFARNFANRYWGYMMGRGLVHPIDDMRQTNPPSHPALLKALTEDFVEHGLRPRHLLRRICNSRTYQLASEVTPQRDADGMFYTHRVYRRIPAEVLLDAIDQAAGTVTQFEGMPPGTRAIALPDPTIRSAFLSAFGRPARTSPCECARSNDPDLAQALQLINSELVQKKVTHSEGRVAELIAAGKSDEEITRELYLVTLSRQPTDSERQTVARFVSEAESRQVAFEDILWTLLNSTRFVFNH